jgi:cobalt-zinc-cadmium efflux system membrane fusion protein
MQSRYIFQPISLAMLITLAISSCHDKPAPPEEKKGYVLPDSLLKTIEIDSVTSSRVMNTLTLTGKVDFNGDNVIKMFPTISGQVSEIKVMPGDYVKQGQVLALIRSSDMAGYSNRQEIHGGDK